MDVAIALDRCSVGFCVAHRRRPLLCRLVLGVAEETLGSFSCSCRVVLRGGAPLRHFSGRHLAHVRCFRSHGLARLRCLVRRRLLNAGSLGLRRRRGRQRVRVRLGQPLLGLSQRPFGVAPYPRGIALRGLTLMRHLRRCGVAQPRDLLVDIDDRREARALRREPGRVHDQNAHRHRECYRQTDRHKHHLQPPLRIPHHTESDVAPG
ncbi:MAG TPA: hypothetical protein VFP84_06860 [Kofleriaceae bacterium]|nr:hypothetical protein [Kofleriaceae bacterium]